MLPGRLLPYAVAPGPSGQTLFVAHRINGERSVVGSIDRAGHLRLIIDIAFATGQTFPGFGFARTADGAFWGHTGSGSDLSRLTFPTGRFTLFPTGVQVRNGIGETIVGPDGNLWFRSSPGRTRFVGRMTLDGRVRLFTKGLPSSPVSLTAAGDAIWFSAARRVWRMSTAGTVRRVRLPDGARSLLVAGTPEGTVWFNNFPTETRRLGRVDQRGRVTLSCRLPGPVKTLVAASDSGAWFGFSRPSQTWNARKVGYITPGGRASVMAGALPSSSRIMTMRGAADGGLLVGYRTGDLLTGTGYIARIPRGTRSQQVCDAGA